MQLKTDPAAGCGSVPAADKVTAAVALAASLGRELPAEDVLADDVLC